MRNKNDRTRPETIPEDNLRLFDDDIEDEIEDDDNQVGTPRSLMLVDRLIYATHENDRRRPLLFQLRRAIVEDEMTFQEAREALVEMQEAIEKLTSPANRIGTLLGLPKKEVAHVIIGGSEYYANIDPQLDAAALKIGFSVLLNDVDHFTTLDRFSQCEA